MNKKQILLSTKKHIEKIFRHDTTGHDLYHTLRVERAALHIAKKEGGDLFIVSLAALLHDVDDWKLAKKVSIKPPSKAKTWLQKCDLPERTVDLLWTIIQNISFNGAGVKDNMDSLEGKIVQDADRLDALGAIGIARAFAYGGAKKRPLYLPTVPPVFHQTLSHYRQSKTHTINHFYEKLLLLKDRMHTKTARKIARDRHRFLTLFLSSFLREWQGNFS